MADEENTRDMEDGENEVLDATPQVITFEQFWTWVQGHPNCILRVANPNMAIYDDDDYHWHFGSDESACFVQVIRGKRYVGELVVDPTAVGSVQVQPAEQDEFVFDLLDSERHFICHFVLSHDYEDSEPASPARRITH